MTSAKTQETDEPLPKQDQPEAFNRLTVLLPNQGLSGTMITGLAMVAAIVLFSILYTKQRSVINSADPFRTSGESLSIPSSPALDLPVEPTVKVPTTIRKPAPELKDNSPREVSVPAYRSPPEQSPQYVPPPPPVSSPPPASQGNSSPVLVVDRGRNEKADGQGNRIAFRGADRASSDGPPNNATLAASGARPTGAFILNQSTTVLQGTLIAAVLETAFDSSRPGYARAVVSRDIRGFDGTKVLIPRGSRLIGEYASEATKGQKRALIVWTRLIRPDGSHIMINSPAADTLGRAGVRGKVKSRFFARFGEAILRSALDIGVNAASAAIGDPTVVVGLPQINQSVAGPQTSAEQPPIITVRQGTSITIFVARDLNFTSIESQ